MIEPISLVIALSMFFFSTTIVLFKHEQKDRFMYRIGRNYRKIPKVEANESLRLRFWLDQAGLSISVHDWILLVIGLFAAGVVVSIFLRLPWVAGVFLSIVCLSIPIIYVNVRRQRRIEQIEKEVEGVLLDMAASLWTAPSIRKAIEVARHESTGLMKNELERTLQELDCGLGLETALIRLCGRSQSDSFKMSLQAAVICRETGGKLAQILERIAEISRDRVVLDLEIKSLVAQPKTTAVIVSLAPIFFLVIVHILDPEYASYLWTPLGVGVLIYCFVSVMCGFLILRRMAQLIP